MCIHICVVTCTLEMAWTLGSPCVITKHSEITSVVTVRSIERSSTQSNRY